MNFFRKIVNLLVLFYSCNMARASIDFTQKIFLVTVVLIFWLADGADGAEVRPVDFPYCDYELSGDIEAQDLSAIKPAQHLCLNSTRGNYRAALEIAKYVQKSGKSTIVASNATCLGPCAIVFMAGSSIENSEESDGTVRSRHLHIRGRLGFGSPSKSFDSSQYSKSQIEEVYAEAIGALAQLIKIDIVRPRLLISMARLGPGKRLLIDTTGKVRMWGIQPFGYPVIKFFSKRMAVNACANQFRITEVGRRLIKLPADFGNCGFDCVDEQKKSSKVSLDYTFKVRLPGPLKASCEVSMSLNRDSKVETIEMVNNSYQIGVVYRAKSLNSDWESGGDTSLDFLPFDTPLDQVAIHIQ